MADIKNITIDGTTYDLKDDKARNDITDLKEDLQLLDIDIIENSYITTSGVITSYTGWSRTDYVDVGDYKQFIIVASHNTSYVHFYKADKTPTGSNFLVSSGENVVTVPPLAKYFIASDDDANIKKMQMKATSLDTSLAESGNAPDSLTVGNYIKINGGAVVNSWDNKFFAYPDWSASNIRLENQTAIVALVDMIVSVTSGFEFRVTEWASTTLTSANFIKSSAWLGDDERYYAKEDSIITIALRKTDNSVIYKDEWCALRFVTAPKVDLIQPIINKNGLAKSASFAMTSGSGHSSNNDRIAIDIPKGATYSVGTKADSQNGLTTQYFAHYVGDEQTTSVKSGTINNSYVLVADNDIDSIGVYISTASADSDVEQTVTILGDADKTIISDALFNANYHIQSTSYLTDANEYSALFSGAGECEAFMFFTDPHLVMGDAWEEKYRNFMSQMQKMYNSVPVSFCLCGGDWLGNSDTENEACFKLGYAMATCRAMFSTFYWLVGNHDTNYQGTQRLTDQAVNNVMFPYGKSYYDFYGKSTHFYAFDTGVENQTLSDQNNYGLKQASWFANALLSDNSKHIAILAHILYYDSNGNIQPLTDEVLSIAEAYNSRSSITVNGTSYNYSGATGKVEFGIFGHLHSDNNATVHGIPCVITTWTIANSTVATFDLVLVDYDNETIDCVRVGSGSDRSISL